MQTYASYDALNRMVTAQTGAWTQTNGYDRYGNRWVADHVNLPSLTHQTPRTLEWFTQKNRIKYHPTNPPPDAWQYDGVGNLTGIASMGRSFTYDGENRQTAATVNSVPAQYAYDGDGRRVRRVKDNVTTVFVYDAAGALAAEYGGTVEPGRSYVTVDHLGSTRLLTDGSGGVKKRYDYLPFGEEIPAGTGGRTVAMGYGDGPSLLLPDKVSQKFTGKERDAETGLDYFGARYMSAAQGRFTSPDAPFADQQPEDPQSWNMYAYVRNNPPRNIDPDGKGACGVTVGSCVDYFIGGAKAVANLVPAAATLVNRVVTGGLVGDAPMFQPSNLDQAQGMQAANMVMLFSPLAEAGAAAAVEAMGSTTAAAAEVPLITQNAARGAASEARVLNDMGLTKNTTPITGTAGRSIPDINTGTVVGDIKDVKVVSNTSQMNIQREVAGRTGRDHVIVTGTNTHVTKPTQQPPTRIIRRDDLGPPK